MPPGVLQLIKAACKSTADVKRGEQANTGRQKKVVWEVPVVAEDGKTATTRATIGGSFKIHNVHDADSGDWHQDSVATPNTAVASLCRSPRQCLASPWISCLAGLAPYNVAYLFVSTKVGSQGDESIRNLSLHVGDQDMQVMPGTC